MLFRNLICVYVDSHQVNLPPLNGSLSEEELQRMLLNYNSYLPPVAIAGHSTQNEPHSKFRCASYRLDSTYNNLHSRTVRVT